MPRHQPEAIRTAILADLGRGGPRFRMTRVAEDLSVTRQAVHRHVKQLIREGLMVSVGSGRNTTYELVTLEERRERLRLASDVAEHELFDRVVKPVITSVDVAAADICNYGFTEMVNNAIDHSQGEVLRIRAARTAASVTLEVADDGVGIFGKIAAALDLPDARQSLLELAKGKFTTDPKRHTGEGIFFTSRVFDRFGISSGWLNLSHNRAGDEWLVGDEPKMVVGTVVRMAIFLPPRGTLEDVFKQFSSGPEDYRFAKTHVPVRLAQYGDDQLVSRSQAKRVLDRVDRFDEVVLDFEGVRAIGQAFADEIFRVYEREHPRVKLLVVNENVQIRSMIARARSNRGSI